MTTSHQAVIARLDELAKELSELHRLVDMLPDQDAHSDCASVLSEENTRDIDADVLEAGRCAGRCHLRLPGQ